MVLAQMWCESTWSTFQLTTLMTYNRTFQFRNLNNKLWNWKNICKISFQVSMIKPTGLFSDRTQLQVLSPMVSQFIPSSAFNYWNYFGLVFYLIRFGHIMIEMLFLEIVGLWHFLTAISRYILSRLRHFWFGPGLYHADDAFGLRNSLLDSQSMNQRPQIVGLMRYIRSTSLVRVIWSPLKALR